MKIRLSEAALRDLDHIQKTIAEDNPQAADRVLRRIDQSISLLERYPEIGRPGLVQGTREKVVPHTPYVVVYEQVATSEIWVLAVIHGRQRYPPAD